MPDDRVVVDVFLVTLTAAAGRPGEELERIQASLDEPGFEARLRESVRALVAADPALAGVGADVSR